MNRLDLYFTPPEAERASIEGRQIVIIDVLRSCTSIAVALSNGASKVIPVESVEEAARLASTLGSKSRLLCGERDGRKVSGFDLGNSPLEYARERVEGATLIFASTNASPLMAGLLEGREQLLLAYVNVGAVADAVRRRGEDVAIVCAGKNKRFALEDAACAGALIRRLTSAGGPVAVNDAAEMAREYDRSHGLAPEAILRTSEHGRDLIEMGFEDDLPVCAKIDSVPVVPYLREGRITALSSAPSRPS
ncbi:MAG TPA: 2-phosphosulfolactate phosphatase [Candidatus Eisenbacteria bacterium]